MTRRAQQPSTVQNAEMSAVTPQVGAIVGAGMGNADAIVGGAEGAGVGDDEGVLVPMKQHVAGHQAASGLSSPCA